MVGGIGANVSASLGNSLMRSSNHVLIGRNMIVSVGCKISERILGVNYVPPSSILPTSTTSVSYTLLVLNSVSSSQCQSLFSFSYFSCDARALCSPVRKTRVTCTQSSFRGSFDSVRKIRRLSAGSSLLDVAPASLVSGLEPSSDLSPFSRSPLTQLENSDDSERSNSAPTSAYVHLPFCRRRCFYCDFAILAVGERTERTESYIDSTMAKYVDLVCQEIVATARWTRIGCTPLNTVFFGGGTPSLLPVPLLAKIIEVLKCHFQIASDAEISMEMDPGTFDREKLAGFLGCGITRVSLGVQSFQTELLQACGRAHGLQEVYDAVQAIHSNGLKNWSLDLMASLPNQTLAQWEHSLKEAVSLEPAHVSVYDLQIEEGTLFNRWYKAGQDPLPNDEKSAELYCMASRRLRDAGFEHYEVSNYARPGFQCKHNLVYWENRPYYAFGLGSTSFLQGKRFSRPRKLKEYSAYVENLGPYGPEVDLFPLVNTEDQVLDTLMLSLRLARGLDLMEFESRFGPSLTSVVCRGLLPFVEKGLVEVVDTQNHTIPSSMYIRYWDNAKVNQVSPLAKEKVSNSDVTSRGMLSIEDKVRVPNPGNLGRGDNSGRRAAFARLTDPEGFLLSNEVISSVFAVLPSGGAFSE